MFRQLAFLILVWATVSNCEVYRLPGNLKPIRYFITLEPPLVREYSWDTMTYNGSIVMQLEVLKNTRNITFNQKNLAIDDGSITVVSSSGGEMKPSATSADEEKEMYTVQLEGELHKGDTLNLTIGKFTGNLGNGEGFFRAFYWVDETARSVAVTHFEPTGARRAFPCFDEPALKANFIVSLIRKAGYNSISNEDLDSTEDLGDGRFKDTFKETPFMSSFTVAFAVSDFKHTEKKERHRIFARPAAIDNGEADYALDIEIKTLKALEDYTGIKFVINKMDQFAVPDGYFHNHAMENWGLVIYGETHLLRDNTSTAEDYKRTTCYIAHEFAHQWFGNLVTPAWWDYLWLAESFSAYFQFYIAGQIEPSWRLMDQFVIDVMHEAFRQEEYSGAHPLNFPIQYSGQYPPFHIMYEKGSTIIRMMEHFLTHDVMKKALQIYLQKRKFSTAMPSDLYSALQESVDKAGVNHLLNNMTVGEILTPWHNSKGFPVVNVTRNYETGSLTLKQFSRFDDNTTDTKWIIPINYVFSSDGKVDFSKTTADYWLTEKSATINHDFPTDGWLVVNKQQTGYYRVNYDLENWERIIDVLHSDNFTSIHVLNRAQLIDDSFNLASKKELPWEVPLRLCEYLIREKDYIPFASFYEALSNYVFIYNYGNYGGSNENRDAKSFKYFSNYTLSNVISEAPTEYEMYKEYLRTTLGGVKDSVGFEPKPTDTHLDELHRTKLRSYRYYFGERD